MNDIHILKEDEDSARENEINWPIKRNRMHLAYIVLTNGVSYLKKRKMIFDSSKDVFLSENIDLLYESPLYQRISINPSNNYSNELKLGMNENTYYLDLLLEYFGFSENLYPEDFETLFSTLFNGGFPFLYYEEFGYQKKKDLMWKNGILVPNSAIIELSNSDPNKYELVEKENPLAEFFPILSDINYLNPEKSFTPLEEEGQIRKRILIEGRNEK